MKTSSIQQTFPESNLLTVKEVSEILRISEGAIYNKIYRGELDHYKLFGKVRFERNYINSLLEKSFVQSKEAMNSSINKNEVIQ